MSVFHLREHLPANTPEEKYTSLPCLQASVSSHGKRVTTTCNIQDEFVIFTSVPSSVIDTLSSSPHLLQRAVLWASNKSSSRIILKLQSPLLGTAKAAFIASFKAKLDKMGMLNDLLSLGAPAIWSGCSTKAPDAAFRPRDSPSGTDSNWPTMVLEVGFLETGPPALRASARWWLENSAGRAGVVVLIFVHATQPRVCVETWEFKTPGPLACKMQEVLVEKRENRRPGEEREKGVAVIGAPLRIPLQKVFLKEEMAGNGDVEFDEEDVRSLARDVWIQQGFWEVEASET